MKNLPSRVRSRQRGSKSPYAKYSKAPYVYSEAYRTWRRAHVGKSPGSSAPKR